MKYHQVGNLYGLQNWVEYGLKQSKNELGWADFRVTAYAQIHKWWEVVLSAYLMVSLHSKSLLPTSRSPDYTSATSVASQFSTHAWWDEGKGWKNLLNNLRLVIQPFIYFNLIQPWLKVFPIPSLSLGFSQLIALMNHFPSAVSISQLSPAFIFSSA